MSLEDNRKLAHRFHIDIIQDQKIEVADEIIHPDALIRTPFRPPGETLRGPEVAKRMAAGDIKAFPDGLFFEHDEGIAEGNKVSIQWTAKGLHKGDLFGIPPSGKEISFSGVDIYTIENGKITDAFVVYDRLQILEQLGAEVKFPQAG